MDKYRRQMSYEGTKYRVTALHRKIHRAVLQKKINYNVLNTIVDVDYNCFSKNRCSPYNPVSMCFAVHIKSKYIGAWMIEIKYFTYVQKNRIVLETNVQYQVCVA